MPLINTYLISTAVLFVFLHITYLIAIFKKDNSIADIFWGMGFVIVAWTSLFFNQNFTARALLATIFVTLWGLRLSSYIWIRNRDKPEDWRYKKWREDWGDSWRIRSYLQVFLLQGFFLLIIASSTIFINTFSQAGVSDLTILDGLGALIWLIGFAFETFGDYQLYQFKQDSANKGKVMKQGLWRYTRHPNYFGEATLWWGLWVMAVNLPWGWLTVVSPLWIDYLLLAVSGIPMLEKRYQDNPDYQQYKKETSAFFPWFVNYQQN